MAKTQQKATPRKKTKRLHPSIAKVIGHLDDTQAHGSLCAQGRERLRWWRRHGATHRDVKAAILTWTDEQIEAYASWLGVAVPDEPDEYAQAAEDLSDALAALPLRPATAAVRGLMTQAERALSALDDDRLKAWVRTTPITLWYREPKDWPSGEDA